MTKYLVQKLTSNRPHGQHFLLENKSSNLEKHSGNVFDLIILIELKIFLIWYEMTLHTKSVFSEVYMEKRFVFIDNL